MILPDPIFVDEALANLDLLDQMLSALPDDSVMLEHIHTMFRCAHSVKGGAAAFGLVAVADLMHEAETLLDQWRQRRRMPDDCGTGLLRECVRLARDGLIGRSVPAATVLSVRAQLRRLVDLPTPAGAHRLLRVELGSSLDPDVIRAIVAMFQDIENLGTVLAQAGGGTAPWQLDVRCAAQDAELLDLLAIHVSREEIAIQRLDHAPVQRMPSVPSVPAVVAPVSLTLAEIASCDRLSGAVSTVAGEMASPLPARGERPPSGGLHGLASPLCPAVRDLRRGPASELFALAPTLLASLSSTLGKTFRLVLAGESLQLDRGLMQRLTDPLIQLVRNACDHGIELPQDRHVVGKPPEGCISLRAHLRKGCLVLEVCDDGQGFSRDQVIQTARARGMDVPDDASDQVLWPLVFSPGFSTASAVTAVSGRGVGMDVVWSKVAALGGTVNIDSTAGVGTCVTMELPASLAPDRSQ